MLHLFSSQVSPITMFSDNHQSFYPKIDDPNPKLNSPFVTTTTTTTTSSSSSMYPTLDMKDLAENLFPHNEEEEDHHHRQQQSPDTEGSRSILNESPVEETLISIPGAILHLIDKHHSVEIGYGDFTIARIRQGENVVALLARVGDSVQWPLAKDEAAVRLDDSHYFFSLHVPSGTGTASTSEDLLNYGLTFASKEQEKVLTELDGILGFYSSFSVQKLVVAEKEVTGGVQDVVVGTTARETAPEEVIVSGSNKKEALEKESYVYWTTLAPNVEDYSSSVARLIAKGSGQLIKGILWCGDVTADRLKWGNELLTKRMKQKTPIEISPDTMKRIKRVKKLTKMSDKVANGILSGVVKVSGFFTSSVVNSKTGKKFFGLLPGEIALATLDGFAKICDAVEVAGKNVLSTSSTVTTGLVSHRYGEQAGEATHESMHAAGHAFGTAWAVFKIKKALNPKSSVKPPSLLKSAAKSAVAELKAKKK